MNNMTTMQLEELIESKEGENLEFREARNNYHFDNLAKYCAALSNEGGGKILLGVSDKRPRRIVGSSAFKQPERTRKGLIERLHLNIDFDVVNHPHGRVLVFKIPTRPIGSPVKCEGIYWQRDSDSLIPMSEDRLRHIFAEAGHDFSADICSAAGMNDLDPIAIENFRQLWSRKSGNRSLLSLSEEQLLKDAEIIIDDALTYAALVLFGTKKALGQYLAQAEVVFEYRNTDVSDSAHQRKEFRQGFFSFYDELWSLINLRNDMQHFQSGLFVLDIPTFSERVIREAVLNAISHRDYQLGGSIFVKQYPHHLILSNPGGFPIGVNEQNILDRQSPRNRRISEVFAKCGLVERAGQGMNLMYELSIRESKQIPSFAGTDQYQVVLYISGEVQDQRFLEFLEKVGKETLALFSTADFLLLDYIHEKRTPPDHLLPRLQFLVARGIVERYGRGRGVKFILNKRFYKLIDKKGDYTRRLGLKRETNKTLLLKHIRENSSSGSRLKEFLQVLPSLTRPQIQTLLRELKSEDEIHSVGRTRAALWFIGSEVDPIASGKNS